MVKAVWNGQTLAESADYQVVEGNIYFPPQSVEWEYFQESDKQYTCPWKGKARYYNIVVTDKVNKNAAWSYPEPKEAAKNIGGYVAFGNGVIVE